MNDNEIHPRVADINARVLAGGTLTNTDHAYLDLIGDGLSPAEADIKVPAGSLDAPNRLLTSELDAEVVHHVKKIRALVEFLPHKAKKGPRVMRWFPRVVSTKKFQVVCGKHRGGLPLSDIMSNKRGWMRKKKPTDITTGHPIGKLIIAQRNPLPIPVSERRLVSTAEITESTDIKLQTRVRVQDKSTGKVVEGVVTDIKLHVYTPVVYIITTDDGATIGAHADEITILD